MTDRISALLRSFYLLCALAPGAAAQSTLTPGPATETSADGIENPYSGDPDAISDGGRLFDWYNCSGCHAPQGAGGMGPPLSDDAWVYGGDASSLFNSIWEGRPAGMPTWAGQIPPDDILKIIAYIQELPVENPAWGSR